MIYKIEFGCQGQPWRVWQEFEHQKCPMIGENIILSAQQNIKPVVQGVEHDIFSQDDKPRVILEDISRDEFLFIVWEAKAYDPKFEWHFCGKQKEKFLVAIEEYDKE